MRINKQNLVEGSSFLRSQKSKNFDREKFMIDNMEHNLTFKEELKKFKELDKDQYSLLLQKFKKKYKDYRLSWFENPKKAFETGNFDQFNPLCLDIETASICDLACPHCFREYILTPDKIMDFDFYKKIIDTAVKFDVPSIKLNWRGEPLLNPKLEKFISYAKKNGILEVSINTNATTLTEKRAERLIDAGLDQIIYSFDGGTKKTYEKMRPARFKKNKFEDVYKNIKNFHFIKKKKGSFFPITKIQMVLTKDTREEIEDFFDLFNKYVDDVTVTQYTERGGNLEKIPKKEKNKIDELIKKNDLSNNTNFFLAANGDLNVSVGRKPCYQLFQRLMITFDGRVAMCCHDWGAQHCLGFIDKKSFDIDKTLKNLEKNIIDNKKGFELLKNAKKPTKYNEPPKKITNIDDIWNGEELNKIRKIHMEKQLDKIDICKNCDFKDTYDWKKIN